MSIDVIEDISNLTNIPEGTLTKIAEAVIYSISEGVVEARVEGKNTSEYNLGIGTLSIKFEEENVKYHFIPSAKLIEGVKNAYVNKEHKLGKVLEKSVVAKIVNSYKEII